MVPSRDPDRDPLINVNSDASALSRCNRSEPETNEIHILGAPWDKRVAGIGYHPSLKA